jgi:AcrR family transcriptional regulator
MDAVKSPDRARPSRRQRALATRLRITKAAGVLFCERGYTGTTMADIADAAGVAVQTVYFVFHTKSDVLNSTYDLAVLGEGDQTPPQAQEWYRRAVAEPNVATAVRAVVEGAGEIVRRVAPLDLAVRTAAASDPDAAQFLARNERLRLEGYREMVDFLATKSPLRAGLAAERATDVLLLLLGPAAYRTLVVDRGWSHAEWVAWSSEALTEQLFGIQGDHRRPDGLAPAT